MARGKYPAGKMPPFVMGFEAAGIVVETGERVSHIKVGDRVTAIVSSGGYAEYATADAALTIPIPPGVSYEEATTIPVQGLSAYALLKLAARPQSHESLLIQSAAGGVGLYLVQLAKLLKVGQVIALAGSPEKLQLLRELGADAAIDYGNPAWATQVRNATNGKGVDVVLEQASGEVGDLSFRLAAPFGRIVLFGAKNIHDTFPPEKIRQVIYKNQTVIGFNLPSVPPEQIARCVPSLLKWIADGRLRMFANQSFPLSEVRAAFEAFSSRKTVGKIVLIP